MLATAKTPRIIAETMDCSPWTDALEVKTYSAVKSNTSDDFDGLILMLIPVRSRYHYCLGETPLTFSVSIILGAPIFLSLPHFKDADPYYLTGIDGLHPEEKYSDY